ncbi:hypothetical protein THAOC_09293, partial [Thalassiosira oceanica]
APRACEIIARSPPRTRAAPRLLRPLGRLTRSAVPRSITPRVQDRWPEARHDGRPSVEEKSSPESFPESRPAPPLSSAPRAVRRVARP